MKRSLTNVVFYAVIAFAATVTFAQPNPDTLWTHTYGGSGYDGAACIQQTADGGYILTGTTDSFGAGIHDFYLVKTDSQGQPLWTRTYGGNNHDRAQCVQQTSDGGYILAGTTWSFGVGIYDLFVVKTNALGDTLWTRTYGGNYENEAFSVRQTADSGYVVCGLKYSVSNYNDAYIVKTDNQGNPLWTRTYGGRGSDIAYSIRQTADGGYIAAGGTSSYGPGIPVSSNCWLLKTNRQGDTLWTRTYGGSSEDKAHSVQQTADGGYIIAGYTFSFGAGDGDFYLVKTDDQGDTLWTRTYGEICDEYASSVQQTADGGFIVAGHTNTLAGFNYDIYVVKTDSSGDTLWTRAYGGSGWDEAFSVLQAADGGYVVAGRTTSYGGGDYDAYSIKIAPDPQAAERCLLVQPVLFRFANFPNPFNVTTTIVYDLARTGFITLRVFDLQGREVAVLDNRMREAGSHRVMFDGSGLASGIYFMCLDAGGIMQTRKLMLLR